MLKFCLRSLLTEYGWQFLRRVVLPHPIKTMRAAMLAGKQAYSGERTIVAAGNEESVLEPGKSIVGVGFCLKPLQPECPAGRFNHDCYFLEHTESFVGESIPPPCQRCAIRVYGLAARRAGCAFYIMTSAHDILFDLFKPIGDTGIFNRGIFLLCRFSLKPFAVGMRVSGVQGWMFPFNSGDCCDYPTWSRADRGLKTEQTSCSAFTHDEILALLRKYEEPNIAPSGFEKRGNIFYPLS